MGIQYNLNYIGFNCSNFNCATSWNYSYRRIFLSGVNLVILGKNNISEQSYRLKYYFLSSFENSSLSELQIIIIKHFKLVISMSNNNSQWNQFNNRIIEHFKSCQHCTYILIYIFSSILLTTRTISLFNILNIPKSYYSN